MAMDRRRLVKISNTIDSECGRLSASLFDERALALGQGSKRVVFRDCVRARTRSDQERKNSVRFR
jgi:hypothetical protein